MSGKKIAYCAVTVSLLVAVQYAFGAISGVELVTVIFLCFCCSAGVACAMVTATAFSLIRCLLFGFYPNVILLYLIYYNAFALLFGGIGAKKIPVWVCPVLLGILIFACLYFAIAGVPVSILYQRKIKIMLWVLLGILAALLVFYAVLITACKGKRRELASITSLAAFCTVCFTLLDDVITPLFYGYETAAGYFYGSFTAMLPQTVCVAISVFFLYYPIKSAFDKITQNKKDRKLS